MKSFFFGGGAFYSQLIQTNSLIIVTLFHTQFSAIPVSNCAGGQNIITTHLEALADSIA